MMVAPEDFMLPCLNKTLFGFECMGCGAQRATVMVFEGELVNAFYMYPAIYTLILLFIAIGINFFYTFKYANRIINILAIISIFIIILSYILKLTNTY